MKKKIPKKSIDLEELKKKLRKIIEKEVKPSLFMHGGDIEIIDLIKKKKGYNLKVNLSGACHGCQMAPITLEYLVQEIIDKHFPKEEIDIVL